MDIESKRILKSSSILLVEDDKIIIEKFSRLLQIYVGKIYKAQNGEEALELYKKLKPSFIITDIKMPQMNGLKFIEAIRKERDNVPIIISAYENKEYLRSSIKLELINYLLKPISNDDLMASLEEVSTKIKDSILTNNIKINDNMEYNPIYKTVTCDNNISRLTINESEILEILLINRGNVVTKQMVKNKLYRYKEMGESSLKNIIYKLRKKLTRDIIVSVERLGYKID